jgi:hypothetical protein
MIMVVPKTRSSIRSSSIGVFILRTYFVLLHTGGGVCWSVSVAVAPTVSVGVAVGVPVSDGSSGVPSATPLKVNCRTEQGEQLSSGVEGWHESEWYGTIKSGGGLARR